jgi:hypothetical protein
MRRILLFLALLVLVTSSASSQAARLAVAPYGPATVDAGGALVHVIATPDDIAGVLHSTASPNAGSGVVFEVEWKHDPDTEPSGVTGPMQPFTVRVAVKKNPGETFRAWAERCQDAVNAQRSIFPPNVPEVTPPPPPG